MDFNFGDFKRSNPLLFRKKRIIAIVENPIRDFLPVIEGVKQLGGVSVYDLIDDWDTSLGVHWYSTEVEEEIIQASTHLAATLPCLSNRLETLSGQKTLILPNAVNSRLFDPRLIHLRPDDLPSGKRILIYVGALWGDWFDWDLLGTLADASPEAQIVLIGDYRGQAPFEKSNVHFLGLKAQKDLPAYLAHADAALIPWKVSNITQATSPLKIYEYLAMRLPVVTPSLEPLKEIPGVFPCDTREEFIRQAGSVTRQQLDEETLAGFIQQNNWIARVDELLGYLNQDC